MADLTADLMAGETPHANGSAIDTRSAGGGGSVGLRRGSPSSMRARFTGTVTLTRLFARLDRVKQGIWLAALGAVVLLTCFNLTNVTNSEAELRGVSNEVILAEQGSLVESSPSIIALSGPADALDTFGGRFAFELGALTLAIVGVMNVFLVVRHTRADEEADRSELLRAGRVGLWAPLMATWAWAKINNLVLGGLIALTFAAFGVPFGPSVLFGLSYALCGLCIAALTMIAAQVFEFGRATIGVGIAIVALSFAIRAIGDVRGSGLIWLSPLGIAQHLDAFGSPRPETLVVLIVWCAAAVGGALWLAAHRDLGAGMLRPRDGVARASGALGTPFGLAWRLQRTSMIAWVLGLGALGAMYGTLANSIDDFIEGNESMSDMLDQMGFDLSDLRSGFLTIMLTQLALFATGGCLAIMLRVRSEERSGRAEPVLAAAVSRRVWAGAHVALSCVAAVAMMFVVSMAMALADGAMTGQLVGVGDIVEGGLARVPAIWLITGIGFALYSIGTRLALAVWGVMFALFQWTLLVSLLDLPDWAANLNPFSHLDHLPATNQGPVAIVVITALAAGAFAMGFTMLGRRDIG